MVSIRIVTETLGGEVSWNDATKTVTLKIDGKEITMTIDKVLEAYGVAPQIMNDRTYVPIRFVVDEIGAEVNWNGSLQKKIMGIALPNGIENGVHQLVKVALSSMVALFGTYQIAANGMAQSIWSLASIMGLAMAPVYTTVIGQCMGARDIDSANFYFKKLNKITFVLSVLWNALVFAIISFTEVD